MVAHVENAQGQTFKTKLNWKSSKPSVVSVSTTGKVKGKKKGKAIITASVNDKKLKIKVRVVAKKKALKKNQNNQTSKKA